MKKWISFPILIACFGLIYVFNLITKRNSPYDDREVSIKNDFPEGASYEYMDRLCKKYHN
jgi:HAE1 family hydrophobic/amphiphilic exporter-1/multidrug efflux pump